MVIYLSRETYRDSSSAKRHLPNANGRLQGGWRQPRPDILHVKRVVHDVKGRSLKWCDSVEIKLTSILRRKAAGTLQGSFARCRSHA